MADAFGRALLDHYRGDREQPLYQRDGDDVLEHPVADFYFREFHSQPDPDWLDSWLGGPLLDVGAGAGRDALYFQTEFDTVAVEISDALVTLLAERGVDQVRHGDMFALPEEFAGAGFRSVLLLGTQVGLVRSLAGLRSLLGDLATVTTADATVVLDWYDPSHDGAADMLGYRPDPRPGLAYRAMHYEYDGLVGKTLCFLLVSPARLRDALQQTNWTVAAVSRPGDAYYYRAALVSDN